MHDGCGDSSQWMGEIQKALQEEGPTLVPMMADLMRGWGWRMDLNIGWIMSCSVWKCFPLWCPNFHIEERQFALVSHTIRQLKWHFCPSSLARLLHPFQRWNFLSWSRISWTRLQTFSEKSKWAEWNHTQEAGRYPSIHQSDSVAIQGNQTRTYPNNFHFQVKFERFFSLSLCRN